MDEKVPFTHPIEVRFRDLDALGHVNNAVLVTFLEHARWQWWHAYLGDRTVADAILDRLVHNSYRIVLKGESMRRNKGLAARPAAPPKSKGH